MRRTPQPPRGPRGCGLRRARVARHSAPVRRLLLVVSLVVASPVLAVEAASDPYAGQSEAGALAALRGLEAQLSLGHTAQPAELDAASRAATASPSPAVRALATAVLAWLDPAVATPPLLEALEDDDARVRGAAIQSLLSLARRFDDDTRRRVISATLPRLDDAADEVACAAAELLGALSPSVATDALRTRASAAGDVRYACYAR